MPGPKKEDLVGRVFTRWVVLEAAEGTCRWLCLCSCGEEKIIQGSSLRNSTSRSCGCLLRELNQSRSTHGESSANETAEYLAWNSMKQRCLNPSTRYYHRYGGRGITVCARWRHSYENFLADVGRRPSIQFSLDRYPNPDGNYEPGNVRWATAKEQASNRSRIRSSSCPMCP